MGWGDWNVFWFLFSLVLHRLKFCSLLPCLLFQHCLLSPTVNFLPKIPILFLVLHTISSDLPALLVSTIYLNPLGLNFVLNISYSVWVYFFLGCVRSPVGSSFLYHVCIHKLFVLVCICWHQGFIFSITSSWNLWHA